MKRSPAPEAEKKLGLQLSGAGYSLSFRGLLAVQIGRFGQMITGDDVKVVLYVVQGRELRLQLFQLRFFSFHRLAQCVIFCSKLLQRRHFPVHCSIDCLRIFVIFDLLTMSIVEFRRPA